MTNNPHLLTGHLAAVAWIDSGGAALRSAGQPMAYQVASEAKDVWWPLARRLGLRPPRNFGRFPWTVRAAWGVAAMLLRQSAELPAEGQLKLNIGLVGTGFVPTQNLNRDFFQDYLESGRLLGRGNLFIYTLPTAALAEVSIAFGLTGPVLFCGCEQQPLANLCETADSLLKPQPAGSMLGLWLESKVVVGFQVAAGPGRPEDLPLQSLLEIGRDWQQPARLVEYFREKESL